MPTGHTITISGTGYSVGDGDSLLVNSTGLYNSTTSTQIFTFTPTTGRFRGFNTSSGQTTPSSNYEIGDTFTATQNLTLYSVEQLPTVTYDLDNLELSVGTHTITAKAKASGFADSVASNSINYVVSSGYTVTLSDNDCNPGYCQYSLDDGANWIDLSGATNFPLTGVSQIKFCVNSDGMYEGHISYTINGVNDSIDAGNFGNISQNYILTQNAAITYTTQYPD